MAPLLVPLCYDFTGPTWTRRLLVLSLMRTSASRSGTTRASVRRTYRGLLSHHLCDRLLSRYTVPPSGEGACTRQTCEVLGDTGGRLRVRPMKTSRPLNVLHFTTSCGVAAGRRSLTTSHLSTCTSKSTTRSITSWVLGTGGSYLAHRVASNALMVYTRPGAGCQGRCREKTPEAAPLPIRVCWLFTLKV